VIGLFLGFMTPGWRLKKYQYGCALLMFSRLEFQPQRGLLSDIGLTGPQGLVLMDTGKLPKTSDLTAKAVRSYFSPTPA